MTIQNYIKSKKKNIFTYKGKEVFIKNSPIESVSIQQTLKLLFSKVPSHLLANFKYIKIGQFKQLIDRDIQAMFKDKTIYVTNKVSNEIDLLDDIIHEIAHSVEEMYKKQIYSDGSLEREFLIKRKQMWIELGNASIEVPLEYFLDPDFNHEFDQILYKKVGYDMLSVVTSKIFFSPYAATSLREYFANGFEAFFMKDEVARLKKISPTLFKKILVLLEEKDYEQF